eukprot:5347703-Alexandrium_andersonii.AAC.1
MYVLLTSTIAKWPWPRLVLPGNERALGHTGLGAQLGGRTCRARTVHASADEKTHQQNTKERRPRW